MGVSLWPFSALTQDVVSTPAVSARQDVTMTHANVARPAHPQAVRRFHSLGTCIVLRQSAPSAEGYCGSGVACCVLEARASGVVLPGGSDDCTCGCGCGADADADAVCAMRGDVTALKRMERAARMADKSSRRLIRKLATTSRNKRHEEFVSVEASPWDPNEYNRWHSVRVHCDAEKMLRRATLAREADGKSFLVHPIVSGLEDILGILVIPKSAGATPEKLARALLKIPEPDHPGEELSETFGRLSRRRLPLFCTADDGVQISIAATKGTHMFARRLYIRDGSTPIYYVQLEDPIGTYATPRDLDLDVWLYRKLVTTASDTLGVRLLAIGREC